MVENKANVIQHLLDVEREALSLIADAETKANAQISDVQMKADADYQKRHLEIISNCEREYQEKTAAITESQNTLLSEYKAELEKLPQDTERFNKLLDKYFFGTE